MIDARVSRRGFLPASAALIGASAIAIPGATQVLDSTVPALILQPGVHRVAANTTIKGDVLVQPGAVIEIAAGRTLTLLGGLVAPIAPIFGGAGTVDLNRSRIVCAHPEWWGAAPGDGARDSLAAMQACLRAHPAMQLLPADYYISDTLVVDRPFARVTGGGFRGTEPGKGTRIIVTSGRADVMRVGPASAPPTVNDFAQNIAVHGVALSRSVAVDAAADRLPAGLRAQYLLFGEFRQVSAFEHAIGFVAQGLVRSSFDDCVAFRSIPGRQAGQPYRGFYLDGSRAIGLAGGNASLFLRGCNATIGGDPRVADGVGMLIEGAFADTFVSQFETAGIATGIRIDGRTAEIGGRARVGHINLHIDRAVIDQCGLVGIDIRDTSPTSLIDLADPYVAAAPRAEAAIRLDRMRGAATITGGQLVGGTNADAGGQALGIAASASHGIQVGGLKILDHPRPAMLVQCSGFALDMVVHNPGSRPGGAAVGLRDCDRGSARLLVSGADGAFAGGIVLAGRMTRLRIDATGVDAAAVGGAANRVRLADGPIQIPSRTANLVVDGV
ncbi:hypothetical protein ABC347_00210 [Sphingomonas sp. 1P06PA]|uniref:hypothetical protein n=1 Tax=Sphingomonas sp. 1P06PA TaxID=554121 RepID=UPI0039A6CBCE